MVATVLIVGLISLLLLKLGLFFATCNHLARWQTPNGYISRISLKNNEIESFEVAKQGAIFIATFLHTRSFNILRRLGIGVKRKTSENQ